MRHILVVDDDPAICEIMRMGLETDGTCRITSAVSADAALVALFRDRPDAAIIDAVLPRTSGLTLARAMINLGVPVLIVSGEPMHQRQLIEAGCPLLSKPFPISRLLIEMRLLLDEATRRKANLAVSLDSVLETRGELDRAVQESHHLIEQARRSAAGVWAKQSAPEDRAMPERASRTALFDEIVGEAIAATGADMGNLQIFDPVTRTLRLIASRGFSAPFLNFFAVVRCNHDSACGVALERGNRIIVPDVTRSGIFVGNPSYNVLREADVRAVQSTPVLGRAGHLIGMISTHRASIWQPSDRELTQLDAVIHRAAKEIEAI